MGNFDSKEYVPSTGGVSKILAPGEHICRVLDISLEEPRWDNKKDELFIILKLEGQKEEGDFEGISVQKDNPDAGFYEGKIASVNNGTFAISTFDYKGKTIDRDDQLFDWINSFLTQMGVFEKVQASSIKAKTIEDYFDKIKPFVINPELWGKFTIQGREYYKDGYNKPNYNLSFPKKSDGKYAFSVIDDEGGVQKFIRFDESEHIEKAKKPDTPTDVENFDNEDENTKAKGSEDDNKDDNPF